MAPKARTLVVRQAIAFADLCVMPVSYAYSLEQKVWVTLNRPEFDRDSISQSIPNFTDATAREFQRTVVEQLTPDCIETGGMTICPGDQG